MDDLADAALLDYVGLIPAFEGHRNTCSTCR